MNQLKVVSERQLIDENLLISLINDMELIKLFRHFVQNIRENSFIFLKIYCLYYNLCI